MESNLFFTTGDPCSSVSEYRDRLGEPRYLVKF